MMISQSPTLAHKTLRIYNIIFGMKKGQTWVARQVENVPKRGGGGVATLLTLPLDMVFVLSVLNRVYNSAEVCSKSVYMYFDLNGVFRGLCLTIKRLCILRTTVFIRLGALGAY